MAKRTVSVALCTYNGERYISAQLESIAAPTRPPDELVVCDDGSKDATVELVERFQRNAPFPVRVYRNAQNLGVPKNFEQAMRLCNGSFIAPSDQDDVWYAHKLAVLEERLLEAPHAGYAFSDADLIDADSKPLGVRHWQRSDGRYLRGAGFVFETQVAALLKAGFAVGCTMMFDAELKDVVLPVSERWLHDYWISLLSSFIGRFGIVVREPLMSFRLHAAQSHGLRPRFWKLLKFLRSCPPDLWAQERRKFLDIRDRLHSQPELLRLCKPADLELLDGKLQHLAQRSSARSAKGLAKLKIVLGEARNGEYGRFSFGWQSALRDLLF